MAELRWSRTGWRSHGIREQGGGEGGIRTLEPLTGLTVFKTVAIDHSATSPLARILHLAVARTFDSLFRVPIEKIFFALRKMAETRRSRMPWRRGRDSNPRGLEGPATLAVWCFRPLSHLSVTKTYYKTTHQIHREFSRYQFLLMAGPINPIFACCSM